MLTKPIYLDMSGIPNRKPVKAKQRDTLRNISVIPTIESGIYDLSNTVTARVRMLKPDGNHVLNDCTINKSNNSITVALTEQMLAVAGSNVPAEIMLTESSGRVTSSTFYIDIEPLVHNDSSIESSKEYKSLENALLTVDQYDGRINQLKETKADEIATKKEIDIERARITNLAKLSIGSTTGDAELIDGRVGADGIIYTNIGSATRSQFNSKLDKFNYELNTKTSVIPLDESSWKQGSLSGSTETDSTIRLRSIPISIEGNKTYKLEFYNDYFDISVLGYYESGSSASNSDYLNKNTDITLKNGTTTVRFLLRYRKNTAKVLTVEEIQHLKIIMYLEENTTKKRFEQIEVDNGIIKKDVAKLKADIVGVTNELAKIKVMSYNMGMFGYGTQQGIVKSELETRLTRWRRFLGKANADLLCTQEQRETIDRDNTALIDENLLNAVYPYRFKYTGGHPTWSGNAINSKYALTDSQEFYLSENESDVKAKRRCVKSYMHVNGIKIRIISCHLSTAVSLTDPANAVAIRKSQMLELLDIVKNEEYFIICGDFNVETGIEEYLTFSQNNSIIANAGYFGAIRTYNYSLDYTDNADTSQDRFLDNAVCSSNIRIDNFEVLDWAFDMCTSDHLPIIAELTIIK